MLYLAKLSLTFEYSDASILGTVYLFLPTDLVTPALTLEFSCIPSTEVDTLVRYFNLEYPNITDLVAIDTFTGFNTDVQMNIDNSVELNTLISLLNAVKLAPYTIGDTSFTAI